MSAKRELLSFIKQAELGPKHFSFDQQCRMRESFENFNLSNQDRFALWDRYWNARDLIYKSQGIGKYRRVQA
jgi:hypothetical protein